MNRIVFSPSHRVRPNGKSATFRPPCVLSPQLITLTKIASEPRRAYRCALSGRACDLVLDQVGELFAESLPSLHSDLYYPVPESGIKTGVLTMSLAALNLLGK